MPWFASVVAVAFVVARVRVLLGGWLAWPGLRLVGVSAFGWDGPCLRRCLCVRLMVLPRRAVRLSAAKARCAPYGLGLLFAHVCICSAQRAWSRGYRPNCRGLRPN